MVRNIDNADKNLSKLHCPIKALKEISEIVDSLHKTPIYVEQGIPMVRVTDIKYGFLDISDTKKVSLEVYEEFTRNHKPKRGDIIISRVGTYGVTSLVNDNSRFCLGQNTAIIIPKINSRYLFYCFQSKFVKNQIEQNVAGSTQKTLSLKHIQELHIPVCDPSNQIAIANILGTLDDKIALNYQMNSTLEAIGQALFKHWFVDFEFPNEEGNPYRSSGGEMVETELGEVPRGWRVGCLGDIADNPRRGIQPEAIEPCTPYIGLEHMPRKNIALPDWDYANTIDSNKSLFHRGDILFGKLRPYFHKVGIAPVNGVCSTDILVIVPKQPIWYGLVLFHISSVELVNHADSTSTGTKMPRTNWADIARFQIVLPTNDIARKFTETILPIIKKIQNNILQSHSLAAIRDALLPKLMSGKIRVNVEREVKNETMG